MPTGSDGELVAAAGMVFATSQVYDGQQMEQAVGGVVPVQVFTAATLTSVRRAPSSVFTDTLAPMSAGDWLMTCSFSWRNTAISQSVLGEWVWDSAAPHQFLRQEAKDSNVNNRIPAVWRTVLTVAEGATPVFDVLLGTTGSSTVTGYDLVVSFEKIG